MTHVFPLRSSTSDRCQIPRLRIGAKDSHSGSHPPTDLAAGRHPQRLNHLNDFFTGIWAQRKARQHAPNFFHRLEVPPPVRVFSNVFSQPSIHTGSDLLITRSRCKFCRFIWQNVPKTDRILISFISYVFAKRFICFPRLRDDSARAD